jgi:TetR/AcrR family transcriptional regulator
METKVVSTSSHDRILQAAKHLFATRGYENTSTIMIARAAGTSESQLVKHFGSKDGLLEAIFDQGWQSMGDLFAIATRAPSPTERLRSVIDQVLAGLERDPDLKELVLFEARRIRRQGQMVLLTRGFVELTRNLEGLLAEMQKQGELRAGVSPQALCSALIGMCEGMLRDQLLARRQGAEPGYNSEDMRGVLEVVLLALASPGQARHASPSTR